MYVEKLHYINVGPIKKLDINFMQNGETIPKPIVIVGKNGSGKSILLSHIVDALTKMQFAKRILNKETPFENIDFSAFIELFKIIRDILQN